jgi:hypothetical protein
LVDILTMTRPFITFLALLLPTFSNPCVAEFMGAYHGIHQLEQQYTQDTATSQEEANGITLNAQSYRHQPTG